jgi:hypothetical protein
LISRRELTSEDVKKYVFEAFGLIEKAQVELRLPICLNLDLTSQILKKGKFEATPLPWRRADNYQMAFGAFKPPDTIILDSRIPFCDKPFNIPDIPRTLVYYTATHEIIHADDHVGGDLMYYATQEHILSEHEDKLKKGMRAIEEGAYCDNIRSYEDLACLWAVQHVDMVTHYRTYVVLRHSRFPKLDLIWNITQNEAVPPTMLTDIEKARNARYVFESIMGCMGEYCIIDILMETKSIGYKTAMNYTV